MIRHFIILIIPLVSLACPGQSPGTNESDRIDNETYMNDLFRLYFSYLTLPNELINGKEYLPYYFHGKTTPLLFSGETFNATLRIRGREYPNTPLQYDTYLDELIYTDTSRMIDNVYPRIALNKDIVEGFEFVSGGATIKFINLKNLQEEASLPEDGFYELAYEGITRFLIRHRSTQYNYNALDEYKYAPVKYILKGGKYFEVRNNRDFLILTGDHSDTIKEYFKRTKINIKRAGKNDIAGLLEFYDKLQDQKREQQ